MSDIIGGKMLTHVRSCFEKICSFSLLRHLIFSFFIRLLLFNYGLWHDKHMSPPYTDVDYYVFTDAVNEVAEV